MSEQKTFKLTIAIHCDTKEQAEAVAATIAFNDPVEDEELDFEYHLGDPQVTEV